MLSLLESSFEGKFAVRALKFPNLMWYLPKLLPKHAAAILIRESDEVLEKLETAIADEPWVFGFSPILRWQLKIIGCEAWLESFKQCNLLAEMPDHIRDALCIYHVMKNDCRSYGHTYLYENYMKRSRSFQGYIVKDWNKAYKFLEKHYVILKDGNRMYLRRYWKYEQMIADSLAELQQRESWSIDFDWAGHKDFQTDGEQQQACRMMCENPITVMSGKGGCGKTHVVSRVFEAAAIEILKTLSDRVKAGKEDEEDAGIAEMSGGRDDDELFNVPWDSADDRYSEPNQTDTKKEPDADYQDADSSEPKILEDPHILLTAPMGKAASLLGRRARLPAFTLHQVMYSFYNSEKDDHGKPVNWKYSIVKALIVDESSMVSVQVFCTVLDILMKHSELCKVVFLGDINQLPSIQPGNFLTDLYRSYDAIGWSISLLTNHRTESELIIQNATRISKQLQPRFDSNHGFHNICINDIRNETLNETSFLSTTLQQQESFEIDGAIRNLLSSKEPRIQDHRKSQFVAFRRIDCERINELCCKHYSSHPTRNHKNKLDFRKGDKICMTQNANVCNLATKKTVRLCNGEIFFIMEYIEKIDEKNRKTIEVTLQDEDRTLRVDFREVRKKCKARHSWARTIHTYQGSESDTVIYVVGGSYRQNWQHVYTAVTRGKYHVYIISSMRNLQQAIDKIPHKRNTRLHELLADKLRKMKDDDDDDDDASMVEMSSHVSSQNGGNQSQRFRKPLFSTQNSSKAKTWLDRSVQGADCNSSKLYQGNGKSMSEVRVEGTNGFKGEDPKWKSAYDICKLPNSNDSGKLPNESSKLPNDAGKLPNDAMNLNSSQDWDEWSDSFGDKVLAFENEISDFPEDKIDGKIAEDDMDELVMPMTGTTVIQDTTSQVHLPDGFPQGGFKEFQNQTSTASKKLFNSLETRVAANSDFKLASELFLNEAKFRNTDDNESIEDTTSEGDLSTATSPSGSDKGERSPRDHMSNVLSPTRSKLSCQVGKLLQINSPPKRSCDDSGEDISSVKVRKFSDINGGH
ncbi:DNA helicase B-like [Glandiceps talaboti]